MCVFIVVCEFVVSVEGFVGSCLKLIVLCVMEGGRDEFVFCVFVVVDVDEY